MQKRPSNIHHIQHLMHRHRRRIVAVFITAIGLLLMFLFSLIYLPTQQLDEEPVFTTMPKIPLGSQSHTVKKKHQPLLTSKKQLVTVQQGENLSTIFDDLHISPQQLHTIAKLPLVKQAIKSLHAGQVLEFIITGQQLDYLSLPINHAENIVIHHTENGFVAKREADEVDVANTVKKATIKSSFFQAGTQQKIPHNILVKFEKIFQWKINFSKEVRKGDKFIVEYQLVKNLKTTTIEPGKILAAMYQHGKKSYYAFLYRDNYGRSNYYDEQGKSLRKSFLRRPVNIGYISSPFNLHRMHPILKKLRPHTGTDFAAPYGTPIHATGDGRIILQGRKGGYGRCIVINHGNNITTLYAHMSRYNKKFKVGSYVKMGDVIGYIGSSGWSTGPHVHYEYRIKHRYKNPMTVPLPNAAPVPSNQRAKYQAYVAKQLKKLQSASA